MSTQQFEGWKPCMGIVAAGLALYCAALTAVTGDIGFNGDDWWVLAYPYWNSFLDSLLLYARKFLRPVEGLYWITLFELFGFNKVVFHFCSLLLLAASATLMGLSLDRAFPGRRDFVLVAVLLAFFLPPVSCLTYVLFTDNSRLSMLLFWASVIAFQRWGEKSSLWSPLALPVALYVASFLTYEAPSFLIFMVPLLVWPVHRRCAERSLDRAFFVKLSIGIATGFAAAVTVRFVFLKGGAVGHSYLVPPLELLWSYLALFPFYLLAPFTSMAADKWALLVGLVVILGTAGLLFLPARGRVDLNAAVGQRFEPGGRWYLVVLGTGIFVLGMLPYQLAGYGSFTPRLIDSLMVKCGLLPQGGDLSWFNFSWASRIYSSASFGVAILLAAGLSGWRKPSATRIGKMGAVAVIGFMAVFHAGLSLDWREAAEIRNNLWQSLVERVPDVKSGTNFVFLDIECSHKRAEVIRKENGLYELIGMLYADRTVGAWRAYSDAYGRSDHLYQRSTVTPEGFLSRGQRQNKPAPHESLLLIKRSGRKLVLLDKITARDRPVPTGIEWNGVEQLTSKLERIEAGPAVSPPEAKVACSAWTSGLISTLQLTRLKSSHASLRKAKHGLIRAVLRGRIFKMLLNRAWRRTTTSVPKDHGLLMPH